MFKNHTFKNNFLIALSFLLSATNPANSQEWLSDDEKSHSWTSQISSNLHSTASAIDYEWDSTKILLTVGAAGVITFGIGPRVADITNWIFPTFIPTIKWVYNRSEIGPLTADLYAKTKGWRGNIPEMPPFAIKLSSLDMPLTEVLPSGMNDFSKYELKRLDQLLSKGITASNQIGEAEWSKLPLYGKFENAQKSMWGYLNRFSINRDYLIGYRYESPRYVVKIEKVFNKHGKKPADERCQENFYQIHRSFKQDGKGKAKKVRYYDDTEEGKHPYLRLENLKSIRDPEEAEKIKSFLLFFIKTQPYNIKSFSQVFNQLIALSSKDFVPSNLNSLSNSSSGEEASKELEMWLDSFVNAASGETKDVSEINSAEKQSEKLPLRSHASLPEGAVEKVADLESQMKQQASETDVGEEQTERLQLGSNPSLTQQETDAAAQRIEEIYETDFAKPARASHILSGPSKLKKNKVQLFLAERENTKHLCFLFLTEEKENYNILLKINDRFNHNFFISLDSEDDKEEDQEDKLDRKGKSRK